MTHYYSEFDPFKAQWLRNLIQAGHIPKGDVDERSITEVQPEDLAGYVQCHFFAGIAGWSLAARIAGWPDDLELWSGSPPCQPFSNAGLRRGVNDERHLWPHYFRLIRARRPAFVVGEQVASAAGQGWIDGVLTDLAFADYAGRAVVLPACSVNAPHKRERLYFVAAESTVGNGERPRLEGHAGDGDSASGRPEPHRPAAPPGVCDPWSPPSYVTGHDGRARRVQPGIQPVGHGFPARVGRLHAYGDAIVPQLGAQVLAALLDTMP